jgi:tetratricopeptide (TPR) repeat protein
MNILELQEAVREIAGTHRRALKRGEHKPFVFVVGAGISNPPVPLAAEIEIHCMEEAGRRGITSPPPDNSAMSRYSHWFDKAYPNAIERQLYLQSLIKDKPISAANFRLAHLLLQDAVASTVVTPNFDDFLSRALTIFGRTGFRVCDHPETVDRIDPEEKEIHIVHVHGTYWFYNLANLRPELENRAKSSPSSAFTMGALLDRIFATRSPIVIGYSGWDGDVIMTALERRLCRCLPYRMYLFCYRRDVVDTLPDWLKTNGDVHFVLPREPEASRPTGLPAPGRREGMETGLEAAQPDGKATAEAVPGEKAEEAVLPAQQVFDELIRELGLGAPDLVSNPLDFFATQLERSISQESDPYSLRSVVTRIRKAQKWEHQKVGRVEDSMEAIRDAMRRSLYLEAILKAAKVQGPDLSADQARELIDLLSFATGSLGNDWEAMLRGADAIVSIGDSLSAEPQQAVDVGKTLAEALHSKAMALDELERHNEEIRVYDDIVKRFGESPDPELQGQVASALGYKTITLGQLDRREEAIAVCNEVVRRFGESSDPALQRWVGWALVNKGVALGRLERHGEGIPIYDEVVRRFGESPDPRVQVQVARALVNKGFALGKLRRHEEALAECDEVMKHFGESPRPALQAWVACALVDKGLALGRLERNEEGIPIYDEVVRRFGESPDPGVQVQVARALVNKGFALGKLQRREEEIAIYDEVVKRFGESPRPALQERVARALVNKAITLGKLQRREEALATRDQVVRRFGGSPDPGLREQVARARAVLGEL